MKCRTGKLRLVIVVITTTMLISVLFASQVVAQEVDYRDFPSLHITSRLNPFLQPREFWHDGALSLVSDNPEWSFSDVEVGLRGRGNATWFLGPEKRPLRIRFETPQGMFGSEAHRDWILLANAFDGSLLRTHLTFYFARMLGDTTNYVTSSQFVHLYINGRYVGVYQVLDERDNGPGRGNVQINRDPAISEYWLEMDMRTRDYFSVNTRYYDLRMPSGSSLTQAHIDYAYDFILNVSESIRAHDWVRINELVCVQSFVDFYIVQEWSKELDINFSSVFMQIRGQGDERRLIMGPFWDFDNSFGNFNMARYGFNNRPDDALFAQRHYWFRYLMQIQEFRSRVTERWAETKWAREAALDNLDYMARVYRYAFERNFDVQPMFAPGWEGSRSPYILEIGESWQNQVDYLAFFARTRAAWLDWYFVYQAPRFYCI